MNDEKRDAVLNKVFRGDKLRGTTAPGIRERDKLPSYPLGVGETRRIEVKKATPGLLVGFARFIFGLKGRPFWEKHLTTLFYGPRSQGKSLHQARTVLDMLKYLDGLYRLYPELPQAIVVSNQKFNAELEKKYLGWRLFYWENIRQIRYCMRENCWKDEYETVGIENSKLVKVFADSPEHPKGVPRPMKKKIPHRLHDCYLIIDDAATIIPADGWQDLPRWFRKMFAQAGHNGVHCLANIQDPLSCDINFRRYTDICFKFSKVMGNRRPEAGKPPVNFIWGIYTSREIAAEELWKFGDMTEEQIKQMEQEQLEKENWAREHGEKVIKSAKKAWRIRFHFIRKRYTQIYDTLQNVPEWNPDSYEHLEMRCIDPKCKFVHVKHRVI